MLLYDIPYIILSYFSYYNLYFILLWVLYVILPKGILTSLL
jgi:predicted secreted protein